MSTATLTRADLAELVSRRRWVRTESDHLGRELRLDQRLRSLGYDTGTRPRPIPTPPRPTRNRLGSGAFTLTDRTVSGCALVWDTHLLPGSITPNLQRNVPLVFGHSGGLDTIGWVVDAVSDTSGLWIAARLDRGREGDAALALCRAGVFTALFTRYTPTSTCGVPTRRATLDAIGLSRWDHDDVDGFNASIS